MSNEMLNAAWRLAPRLPDLLAKVPVKRRPSAVRAAFVAVRLADAYRPYRGYVDESVGQVAAATGLTEGNVKDCLNALASVGVWVPVEGRRGGGPSMHATRRVPGPVLAGMLAEGPMDRPTPADEDDELGGADPAEFDGSVNELGGVDDELGGVDTRTRRGNPATPLVLPPCVSPNKESRSADARFASTSAPSREPSPSQRRTMAVGYAGRIFGVLGEDITARRRFGDEPWWWAEHVDVERRWVIANVAAWAWLAGVDVAGSGRWGQRSDEEVVALYAETVEKSWSWVWEWLVDLAGTEAAYVSDLMSQDRWPTGPAVTEAARAPGRDGVIDVDGAVLPDEDATKEATG